MSFLYDNTYHAWAVRFQLTLRKTQTKLIKPRFTVYYMRDKSCKSSGDDAHLNDNKDNAHFAATEAGATRPSIFSIFIFFLD